MADNTPEKTGGSVLVSTGIPEIETGKMLVVARRTLRKGPESLQSDDTAIWSFVLSDAGVEADDIMPALLSYMKSNEWFPAPCQIIEHARMIREKRINKARLAKLREEAEMKRLEEEAERERWESLTPEEQEAERAERRAQIDAIRARFRHLADDDAPKPAQPSTRASQVSPTAENRRVRVDGFRSMRDFAAGAVFDTIESEGTE
jgi:hypothetical protein